MLHLRFFRAIVEPRTDLADTPKWTIRKGIVCDQSYEADIESKTSEVPGIVLSMLAISSSDVRTSGAASGAWGSIGKITESAETIVNCVEDLQIDSIRDATSFAGSPVRFDSLSSSACLSSIDDLR